MRQRFLSEKALLSLVDVLSVVGSWLKMNDEQVVSLYGQFILDDY